MYKWATLHTRTYTHTPEWCGTGKDTFDSIHCACAPAVSGSRLSVFQKETRRCRDKNVYAKSEYSRIGLREISRRFVAWVFRLFRAPTKPRLNGVSLKFITMLAMNVFQPVSERMKFPWEPRKQAVSAKFALSLFVCRTSVVGKVRSLTSYWKMILFASSVS